MQVIRAILRRIGQLLGLIGNHENLEHDAKSLDERIEEYAKQNKEYPEVVHGFGADRVRWHKAMAAFPIAAQAGDLKTVSEIHKVYDIPMTPDKGDLAYWSKEALIQAIVKGHHEIVEYLLDVGIDPEGAPDKPREDALLVAAIGHKPYSFKHEWGAFWQVNQDVSIRDFRIYRRVLSAYQKKYENNPQGYLLALNKEFHITDFKAKPIKKYSAVVSRAARHGIREDMQKQARGMAIALGQPIFALSEIA